MNSIEVFIKNYFSSFLFFYRKVKTPIFLQMFINIVVGFLDGLGLAMFLPLLQMVDEGNTESTSDMGNLKWLVLGMEKIGLELSLKTVLMALCLFFLLKGVAQFINGAYGTIIAQRFAKELKIKIYKLLSQMSFKEFVKSDVGRIQNSMTGEIYQVIQAYTTYFAAFQYLILVIVYMVFAFLLNPKFAGLIIVGGVLSNLVFVKIFKVTKVKSNELSKYNHQFQGLVIQLVSQYKYLKAVGMLKKYTNKLDESIDKINNNQIKIGFLGSFVNAVREPILIVIVSVVIFIQVTLFGGQLGVILISLLFFYRALGSLMMMQTAYNSYLSVSGALNNIKNFEIELEEAKEKFGTKIFSTLQEGFELKNASFSYNSKPTIRNVDLKINKNDTIAFVGESGGGKTTIINILTGLLPLDNGLFLIDNIDRNDIMVTSFQRRIGYITQDAVIFNDTIFNNVTFWDEPTTENKDRFKKAVIAAASLEFINLLPDKEATILGNNGINLSGGQKQRISIARELYKDIDILVLDEATSALDSETEQNIKNSIEELKGKYTILVVAHRLSTIKDADKIVFMDNGAIIEVGTFTELLSNNKKFKKMVELQNVS
jgi:ABC-type multidrug transport system fused ATPase/permease subunit